MRVVAVAVLALLAIPAEAQEYRVRLDSRIRSAAFRGYNLDSIARADVVTGPGGGFGTPDGFAVTCREGFSFCTYYRPAATVRTLPLTQEADIRVWNLGIPGLRFQMNVLAAADPGDEPGWPGTEPAVQLRSAVASYVTDRFSVRAGRTQEATRFGFTGFDGAAVEVRPGGRSITATVYGGWSLARSAPLPTNSDELNPLGQFQPRRRAQLGGATLRGRIPGASLALQYRREVEPETESFVSELIGVDGEIELLSPIYLRGGVDYDLAQELWGTADITVGSSLPSALGYIEAGARRYRPRFDLWTIWAAFSPVPYDATFGRVHINITPFLNVFGSLEAFEFENAEAATPLVRVDSDGSRYELGASYAGNHLGEVTARARYFRDDTPGAAADGFDVAFSVAPHPRVRVLLNGGVLQRPLEFRFNTSELWTLGARVAADLTPGAAFFAGVRYYDELRDRPDAARLEWNRLHFDAGLTLLLESAPRLSPARLVIMRLPDAPTESDR